jgi:putative DNA primase/helicase
MDLRSIAAALGGEVSGRHVLCPGPGHSRNDRSLSVKIEPNAPGGLLVHSFCGDDPITCKDYVRSKVGLPQWQPGEDDRDRTVPQHKIASHDRAVIEREAEERRPMTEDDLDRIERARRIWDEADDPRNTLAEVYLRQHRNLNLPDDLAGNVLRYHPRCPWRDENIGKTIRVPALIAAFRSIDDDAITGIHRIALKPDGSKIDRKMLGMVRRTAVKIDAAAGRELLIGEGIESCMAARQLGCRVPVWALGSSSLITFFPVVAGVRRLLIHGEPGEASAEAVKSCGQRWSRAGRRVDIVYSTVGSDFNDEIMMKAAQ